MNSSNTWRDGSGRLLINVHSSDACAGEYCTIHNPSKHLMSEFPQVWRDDVKFMERICPHGIGHPDPDERVSNQIHGCCGCCG
jgi:hypothetical protein